MNNSSILEMDRRYLFSICMVSRLFLAYYGSRLHGIQLTTFGWMIMLIGVSMVTIYTFGLRDNGWEAGGKIWWNDMRPFHGGIFIGFGIMAIRSQNYGNLLYLDAIIGIVSWVAHRITKQL